MSKSSDQYDTSFLMMLGDNIKAIGEYSQARNFKVTFETMQFILAVIEPEDREANKEFVEEIESAVSSINSTYGRNWNHTLSLQTNRANELWDYSYVHRLMKIIWDGGYLIKEKYATFYDTAKGRKSRRDQE